MASKGTFIARCRACNYEHAFNSLEAVHHAYERGKCPNCSADYKKADGMQVNIKDWIQDSDPSPSSTPPPKTAHESLKEEIERIQKMMKSGGHPDGKPKNEEQEENAPGSEKEVPYDPVFKSHIQSVMTDNKFDRVVRKRAKGKLDMKNLWRAQAKATNVFAQKQARKNKRYDVVLLVDQSGSMNQGLGLSKKSKAHLAGETCASIAQALAKIDGVDVSIIGFNAYYSGHDEDGNDKPDYGRMIHTYKKFGQKIHDMPALQQKMSRAGGGNDDYAALMYAYGQLKHKDNGKILLVFSDGEPASNNSDWNDTTVLRNLVTSHKDVTTVGIGIESVSVESIYPQHILIESEEDFKIKILSALRRNIKRG